MSATAEPPLPQPRIDVNEESRVFGFDGTVWVELAVDADGQLQSALSDALQSEAADEVRVRAFGPDAAGALQQANAEQFDTALGATDVGLATWGDRALRTLAQDHVQTVIHGEGAGGALQEVGVEAFNSAADQTGFALLTYGDRALQTQGDDEFRSRTFGVDAGGTLQQVNAEQLGTALGTTDVGLASYGDRALESLAQDELRARPFAPDAGGALRAVIAEQLDTAVAATDVGLLTWVARALNSIGSDELVSRLTDATGTQIDPDVSPDYPESQTVGHDLVGTGDLVIGPISVAHAEAVVIAATSTDGNIFDVSVDWEDGAGNVFQSESPADIGLDDVTEDWARLVRKGPQVEVTFTDASGAASNNINAHVDAER